MNPSQREPPRSPKERLPPMRVTRPEEPSPLPSPYRRPTVAPHACLTAEPARMLSGIRAGLPPRRPGIGPPQEVRPRLTLL